MLWKLGTSHYSLCRIWGSCNIGFHFFFESCKEVWQAFSGQIDELLYGSFNFHDKSSPITSICISVVVQTCDKNAYWKAYMSSLFDKSLVDYDHNFKLIRILTQGLVLHRSFHPISYDLKKPSHICISTKLCYRYRPFTIWWYMLLSV